MQPILDHLADLGRSYHLGRRLSFDNSSTWNPDATHSRRAYVVPATMLLPKAPVRATPAASSPAASDLANIQHAIAEAQLGLSEGGVPIGACLVNTKTGEVIGSGRNRRVQMGSATRHGETDCLERIGRLPAKVYRECTMYTTLSPWKASVLSSLPCQMY